MNRENVTLRATAWSGAPILDPTGIPAMGFEAFADARNLRATDEHFAWSNFLIGSLPNRQRVTHVTKFGV